MILMGVSARGWRRENFDPVLRLADMGTVLRSGHLFSSGHMVHHIGFPDFEPDPTVQRNRIHESNTISVLQELKACHGTSDVSFRLL